jgi:hypothetical protein
MHVMCILYLPLDLCNLCHMTAETDTKQTPKCLSSMATDWDRSARLPRPHGYWNSATRGVICFHLLMAAGEGTILAGPLWATAFPNPLPRHGVEVLLVHHITFAVDSPIENPGRVIASGGQTQQVRFLFLKPVDRPGLDLRVEAHISGLGQPLCRNLIQVLQRSEGAAVEQVFEKYTRKAVQSYLWSAADAGGKPTVESRSKWRRLESGCCKSADRRHSRLPRLSCCRIGKRPPPSSRIFTTTAGHSVTEPLALYHPRQNGPVFRRHRHFHRLVA